MRRLKISFALSLCLIILWSVSVARAVGEITEICDGAGIQLRTPDFQPGGIILTTFDSSGIWVYEIDGSRRYPLPETRPCGSNCHLSPDARWITYPDPLNNSYIKMRLNGTERTQLVQYATDVEWWSPGMLLVWTPGHTAYLQAEDGSTGREYLDTSGVISVQPSGRWGMMIEPADEAFMRVLVNIETRNLPGIAEQRVILALDVPYFNVSAWSPNGQWLAYSAPGAVDDSIGIAGTEIYGIHPGDTEPTQWTDFNAAYGAVRINGHSLGQLSWSPDSSKIAFWVIELIGADPTTNTGNAVIHLLDVATGAVRRYCGFTTTEHTPNPPRLVWSPDSTHIAFGGNVPGDDRGYLLMALDIATGRLTELSDGVFPALGSPDPIVWGLPPG